MEYEYTWIPSIGPVLQSRKLEDATAVVDWICLRPTPLRENEVDALGVAAAAAMGSHRYRTRSNLGRPSHPPPSLGKDVTAVAVWARTRHRAMAPSRPLPTGSPCVDKKGARKSRSRGEQWWRLSPPSPCGGTDRYFSDPNGRLDCFNHLLTDPLKLTR